MNWHKRDAPARRGAFVDERRVVAGARVLVALSAAGVVALGMLAEAGWLRDRRMLLTCRYCAKQRRRRERYLALRDWYLVYTVA
jgi:hypothetical protein